MKETTFIEQNKNKWAKFEKLSSQKNNDPDEVAELFTEITEDLSYARTFYPRRSVRVYLNQLSQGVFTKLYKQKKQPLGSFKLFWVEQIPLELYRMRYNLLAALVFFCLAAFLGAVSQHYDVDFVNLILGEGYVDMTEENIADGNPMGVYGTQDETSMFFAITINNIRVAFITFALGIFASLGSYLLLLQNGIMLGAFQWWFKAKGLLLTTFLAIWIHGAFEISAIIIAGGAGITVGNGILFPKSYSRLQSLIFSAKRGLLIMLSLVPIFIMAGALESFVTRHYLSMPDFLKWFIILVSFGLIILYYGIYPFIVARKYPEKIDIREVPKHIPEKNLNLSTIRTLSDFFSDSLYLFISKLPKINSIFIKIIFPTIIIISFYILSVNIVEFSFSNDSSFLIELMIGSIDFDLIKFLFWPLIMSLVINLAFYIVKDNSPNIKAFLVNFGKSIIWIYLYSLLLFSIITFSNLGLLIIIFILLGSIIFQIPAYILLDQQNIFIAISNSFKFEKGSYLDGLINTIIFITLTTIFFLILSNPWNYGLLDVLNSFLTDVLVTSVDGYQVIINVFNAIIYTVFFSYIFILFFQSVALIYYSNSEKKKPKGLYERLEKFGKLSKTNETEADFE